MMKWFGGPAGPAVSAGQSASHLIFSSAVRFLLLAAPLVVVRPTTAKAFQDLPAPLEDASESAALASAGVDFEAMAAGRAHMSRQLADNLALLFEKFERSEFVVCLEGEVNARGELSLSDFRIPHIVRSHGTSVTLSPTGTCAQYDGVIATLHTHPPISSEDRRSDPSHCYLSRTDIETWLEATDYPYTAVLCGPRTWALWHRSQVESHQVRATPPENQLHQPASEDLSRAGSPPAGG